MNKIDLSAKNSASNFIYLLHNFLYCVFVRKEKQAFEPAQCECESFTINLTSLCSLCSGNKYR